MSTATDTKLLIAEIADLKAKLEAEKKAGQRPLSIKVSEKGCVCVYGLGKWPFSLYPGQWERLAAFLPTVLETNEVNSSTLEEINTQHKLGNASAVQAAMEHLPEKIRKKKAE